MKLPVRLALSAIATTFALTATACSSETAIGAGGPAAEQQEQSRGVAVDPLLTATPTAAPDPQAPSPSRRKPAAPQHVPNAEPLAFDATLDRLPLFEGYPAFLPASVLAVVDYTGEPMLETSYVADETSNEAPAFATGLTPDGTHAWVALSDPSGAVTCPEGQVGSQLGVAPIDSSEPARLVDATGIVPPNVNQVHYGPDGHAVLYASCGKYSSAVALAQVATDGSLSKIRPLPPQMQASLWVYPPRWIWGTTIEDLGSDKIGELMVVIPQLGVAPQPDSEPGTADVFINVDKNEIVDVRLNPNYLVAGKYLQATWDGNEFLLDGFRPPWSGPLWTLEQQAGYASNEYWIAAGGEQGATIIGTRRSHGDTLSLTGRSVSDLAWSPSGEWIALTGPDGTTLHEINNEGDTIRLFDSPGESVHFTPDGSGLVVINSKGFETIVFPSSDPNPGALTPFSALDSGGLGPIRVGMSVSELSAALTIPLSIEALDGEPAAGSCVYVGADDFVQISILAEATSSTDGTITAITVWDGPWKTPSGLGLGSSETAVLDALGDSIVQSPHTYTPGQYLDFIPSDESDLNSVRFATNGHQVISISVGRQDWVGLVEGCA